MTSAHIISLLLAVVAQDRVTAVRLTNCPYNRAAERGLGKWFFIPAHSTRSTLNNPPRFTIVRPATCGISMVHAPELTRELSFVERLIVAGVGLSVLVLLLTARNLAPDPRGFGTHEQLGLTPCSFFRWTGRECPTCGATTAWAHVLRGEGFAGAASQLGGHIIVPRRGGQHAVVVDVGKCGALVGREANAACHAACW